MKFHIVPVNFLNSTFIQSVKKKQFEKKEVNGQKYSKIQLRPFWWNVQILVTKSVIKP